MKNMAILALILILGACAANPTVVKVKKDSDQRLNCHEIQNAIQETIYYKKEARKDDKFKLQYMMPLNAIISTININRAESSAEERVKYLEELARNKGCMTGNVLNVNYPGQPQYQYGY